MKPTIKSYNSRKEFYSKVEPFLLQNEIENNLPLGIIGSSQNREVVDTEILLTMEIDDKLSLVMYQDFGNMMVIGEDRDLEYAVDYIINHKLPARGVIGNSDLAESFSKIWSERSGKEIELQFNQRVYSLEKVNEVPLSNGIFRLAEEKDKDILAEWILQFLNEALNESKMDIDGAKERVQKFIDTKKIYVWDDNGIVTTAFKTRPTKNCMVISGVYTPKDLRGKGYATSCVAMVSKEILKEKKFAALYTDLANPTSNSIYMNIGYKPVSDSKMIKFCD